MCWVYTISFPRSTLGSYDPPSLSSTHFLTAFLLSAKIQALLQRLSLVARPSSHLSLISLDTPPVLPVVGLRPHSCHRRMTVPAHDQISSHSTSNSRNQSLGRGIRCRRVVSSIDATASTCGGCIAYSGVSSL